MKAPVGLLLLFLVVTSSACNSPSPYVTTIGILKPGETMTVAIESGTLNAYQPVNGTRRDLFTVSATAAGKGPAPPAPQVRGGAHGTSVRTSGNLRSLLVRVPDRVNFVVQSQHGDVNVTDITGNVRVVARQGNVELQIPGYAQAAVGNGNLLVRMGATQWPGTLSFSTRHGDIEVWIIAKAAFTVHLHTDDGVLFTDFGLRGVSNGRAETIDGAVNGGSSQRIDIESSSGAIRLLRLQPQP